jgi:cytochrome c5
VRSRFSSLVLAATLLVFAMGHGDGCGCGSEPVLGPPTNAICPPAGSTLTYANFGQQFMTTYCTRCHSSTLTGAARMGATAFHDFDTIEGIRPLLDHIDETAGAGPDATNDSMPPNGTKPSLAERQMLAEWLACQAP